MAVKSIRNQENSYISKSTFLSGNYLHRVNSTLKQLLLLITLTAVLCHCRV